MVKNSLPSNMPVLYSNLVIFVFVEPSVKKLKNYLTRTRQGSKEDTEIINLIFLSNDSRL